jgi:hypothetical protein
LRVGKSSWISYRPLLNNLWRLPLSCLSGGNDKITGTFALTEDIKANGKSDALVRSLQGKVEFITKDGKFYRYLLLVRILAFLNIIEILRASFLIWGGMVSLISQ